MATARDICKGGLRRARLISEGADATASELADALELLNDMIAFWGENEGLTIPHLTEQSATLTVNQGVYTWGTGANLNLARPMAVETAWLVGATDSKTYPLSVMNYEQYARIENKSDTGRPERYYFEPELTPAKIRFDRLLGEADTFYALVLVPLTTFTSLDTTHTLASGYLDLFKWNLAERVCAEYGRSPPPLVAKYATYTFSKVKQKNAGSRNPEAQIDPALTTNAVGYGRYGGIDRG